MISLFIGLAPQLCGHAVAPADHVRTKDGAVADIARPVSAPGVRRQILQRALEGDGVGGEEQIPLGGLGFVLLQEAAAAP